jgi:translocation and assembly module TamB
VLGGLRAKQITLRLNSGPNDRVVIDAPQTSALDLLPSANPGAWFHLRLDKLSARRVSVQLAPSATAPSLPTSLQWPIELEVAELRVGELELPGLQAHPFRDVSGRVHLGASGGRLHQAEALAFAVGPMLLKGQAQIGTADGLPLQVQLAATQATDANAPSVELPTWARALRQDWRAQFQASGPLARFDAKLELQAQGQRLDATGTLAPIEAWPVPVLDARTERLDLSALLTQAPATALSGTVRIAPVAGHAGTLAAQVSMVNERPGRWDERRLPVRRASFELRARPGALAELELLNAEASLAGEGREAGSVKGRGEWRAGAIKLEAALSKVQPGRLDPRLPAMTVSGPFKLDAQLGGATPRFELQAELDGHLNADVSRAVRVRLAADGSPDRLNLNELLASAGAAQLNLSGTARRSAATAPWQLEGKARLNDFDPLPWFPGAPQSRWRAGPHRFNADAEFALELAGVNAPPASLGDWLEWLPTLNGRARVALKPSVVAGVGVQGEAALQSQPGAPTQLTARIDAAGNLLNAQGHWARGVQGRDDAWTFDVKASQIGKLAPWFALGGVPAPWASPTGAVNLSAKVDGRWPELRAQGQLDAQGLRAASAGVARANGRWAYSSANDTPFDLHLELTDARWAEQKASRVQMDLKGTPAAHALTLQATLNAEPPAWTEAVLGNRPAAPGGLTRVQLEASGSYASADPARGAAPALWRGRLQKFELQGGAADATPIARLRDVGLEFQPGDAQRPISIALQAGRGELLGAALRWERLFWQGATAGGAAPLFGWRGDLRVAGRIAVRSTPQVEVDVVLERQGGDLSVTDETGTQALQLTDLRLALNAKDGQWNFTQALAGKTLGVAAGAVSARLPPGQGWPDARTPIQGVLEARVASLGTWGSWVPPGWRLAGALRTSASIGGRLGAPEYTGEMRGTEVGVRNLVQGVNVTDGDITISLRGTNARIERFEAKAGAGSVRLEGAASLGETPKAQLRVVADKFQLLGRVDRRVVTSGTAQLQLDAKSLTLDGRFMVDEGLIDFTRGDSPALSDDVHVSGRPGDAPVPSDTAAPPRGSARAVTIDLQVGLGNNLRVRGRGLDTQLRGDLRLTTPANRLAINGTVRAATGTYAAYGQKLSIERGELTFTGVAENPRLDIIATRPNLEQTVGVAVTGTVLNPRVRLFSEPEMPDIDKLSWLVLGRASDGLGRTDTALLQRAAIGLLAGEGTGPTDQLIQAVGLDEVSFRQTEGEVRETVVSLGKQLSRRWYVGYERSLNATTGNWQLIYRVAQRLTLRAQSGLDNSLDAIWTWRWQ